MNDAMTTYRDPGEEAATKTWKRITPKQHVDGGMGLFDAPAPSVPRETSETAADAQHKTKRASARTVTAPTSRRLILTRLTTWT